VRLASSNVRFAKQRKEGLVVETIPGCKLEDRNVGAADSVTIRQNALSLS
jgi:hypothetical protein